MMKRKGEFFIMKKVALFDFDQTFYRGDTFSLLMTHLREHPQFKTQYYTFLLPSIVPALLYKMNLIEGETIRQIGMQNFLKGLDGYSIEEATRFFKELEQAIYARRHRVLEKKLRQFHDDGYITILVSGAYVPFLQAVTERFSFDAVFGTDIPLTDGKIDASIPIEHRQAEKKVEAILHYLRDVDVDWANSYAFSDRLSDLPMLELVGHPVAVNAERRLQQEAAARGWQQME